MFLNNSDTKPREGSVVYGEKPSLMKLPVGDYYSDSNLKVKNNTIVGEAKSLEREVAESFKRLCPWVFT